MSKLSPLASPFIPFGQDKVEEEKDDVSLLHTFVVLSLANIQSFG